MSIRLIYFGKDKKNIYSDAEQEFSKRIKRYSKFEIIALNPPKISKTTPRNVIQENEEKILIEKFGQSSPLILLDEKGKERSSLKFAKFLDVQRQKYSPVNFVIGGAFGFSDGFKQRYNEHVALSQLTFPHHLARVLFLEQIYRAFTILNNEPYHNE